eukprot:3799087-Rhodomonas_salina.1
MGGEQGWEECKCARSEVPQMVRGVKSHCWVLMNEEADVEAGAVTLTEAEITDLLLELDGDTNCFTFTWDDDKG